MTSKKNETTLFVRQTVSRLVKVTIPEPATEFEDVVIDGELTHVPQITTEVVEEHVEREHVEAVRR